MKKELDKYLKSLSRAELEKEIKLLYTKFEDVKKYYQIELSEDTEAIVQEFKSRLRKEYFPSRGFGRASNKESRKVITEFKKISIFSSDLVELLLYRVEVMLEFTNAYGDIDEPFYNSLVSSYREACKLIKLEKLEKEYRQRCQGLMNESYYFGWGVYDEMKYEYEEYLE